ncbi:ABC transporter substrate-binding protein [Chitinimonas sp. BJYL2]|uniref:substrate-binding periplasmic protein n=1 Tax=Chitinimonas sp. BJYL2 TaxID=2976696 RepID=UPI0022B32683|nr:transporter substrate-binding domain-containing protein [Chitinimonas sp. BJYL2]
MMKTWIMLLALAVWPMAGQARDILLATTEWPPYTSQALPGRGANTEVVRAALAAAGWRLQVQVLPWSRTVRTGMREPGFSGYFPEYDSPEVRKRCRLSQPIGSGPLGVAYQRSKPFEWATIADLQGIRLGVVQDYVNTPDLDAAISSGKQPVDRALDDAQNLLKLAGNRIDAAVIDRRVFEFLMQTEPRLRPVAGKLAFHDRLLGEKLLYVCFRPDPSTEPVARRFDESMRRLDANAIMQRYQTNVIVR